MRPSLRSKVLFFIMAAAVQPYGMDVAYADNLIDLSNKKIIKVVGTTDENRTVNFAGNGGTVMNVYGGGNEGTKSYINIGDSSQVEVYLYGGYNDDPLADHISGNVINVTGGGSGWSFYENTPTSTSNALVINTLDGGEVQGNIVAGHSSSGSVTNNTINLFGGKLNGVVVAGETTNATDAENRVTDNTINIYGNGDYDEAEICGSAVVTFHNHIDSTTSEVVENIEYTAINGKNNVLNVYVENQNVGNISGFSNINFYLPNSVRSGSNILLGKYDISSIATTAVSAHVGGGTVLYPNDYINLFQNPEEIYSDSKTSYSKTMSNISATYTYYMGMPRKNLVQLKVTGKTINPQTKVILANRLPLLPNQQADLLTEVGGNQAAIAAAINMGNPETFFAMKRSKQSFNPSDLDIDLSSTCMVLGTSRYLEEKERPGYKQLLAPFIEYGDASYEEYFTNNVKGDGKQTFYGIGYLARGEKPNGSYQEGALRIGRLKIDFSSDSMIVDDRRIGTSLSTNSLYLGGHYSIGRKVEMKPGRTFDYYGRFLWGVTSKANTSLSTGDQYTFSQVNSYRLRIGGRYNYLEDNRATYYCELAGEYEFDGRARGSYQDLRLPEISTRGASAIIQLGWETKTNNGNTGTELQLGYSLGHRRGFSINGGINWHF